MAAGPARLVRQAALSGLWLCLLTGCATLKPHQDALDTTRAPTAPTAEMMEHYRVGCPDVLEVVVVQQPAVRPRISVEGRIDLGQLGQPRVDGLTCSEIAQTIAECAHVRQDDVQVKVAEFNSQEVYIFGEVKGVQRAVPYRGGETVLELLRRAGGLSEGAEPNDVYVVRAHIADGGRPEVFPIPLTDAGSVKDAKADLKLQPFDQVYIGETRQWGVCRALPPCLRPLYESLWGMKRTEAKETH
jgi:protein involved in polysaccharide export with SLBB domain